MADSALYMFVYACGKMPTVFCDMAYAKKFMREEPKVLKVIDMTTGQCVLKRADI